MSTKNLRAHQILEQELYATIATSSKDGIPWNSPVYICYDDDYSFYWSSAKDSQHSLNINENDNVFLVIFSSVAPWGKGEGVYIQAKAKEIIDQKEIAKAIELRFSRVQQGRQRTDSFIGNSPRRIYKAVPTHFWINEDVKDEEGNFIKDRRVEIYLD